MLDPQRPVSDYLDDFVHGVLDDQDTARVEAWLDESTDGKALLAAAQRRKEALAQVPPVEASERLIRSTLEAIEMKATRPRTALRVIARSFLALAAMALVLIGLTHAYYHRLAPSPYSLRLFGQSRLLAGSDIALRMAVVDHTTGEAVRNVPVEVSLVNFKQGGALSLTSFRTADDGTGTPRFMLPDWQPGDYLLRFSADLPTGREVLEEKVTLTRSFKLLLSTDKPIYQPGQLIHLRSLALRRPDLRPVDAEPVVFEVIDSKGNVIFKHRGSTSAFGIASADCQLAHEINTGDYQLRCTVGDTTSERTVKVEKYVLPKFKLSIQMDKPFYQPGERVTGTVQAKYFFGQAVVGGKVKLEGRSTDVTSHPFNQQELTTDADGNVKFEFTLPAQLIGTLRDQGHARFQLFATVTDSAGQSFTAVASRLVTRDALQIEVIPEGGTLVRGLPNRVFIHTSYVDGKPAVTTVAVNELPSVKTNEFGIAVVELTPKDAEVGLTVTAEDSERQRTVSSQRFICGTLSNDFVLRADKAVYAGGDTMKLSAVGGGVEPVFIDLIKDGQTMLSQSLALASGKGALEVDLPPELFGSIELVAYRLNHSGHSVRKSRLIFIKQAQGLTITSTLDQDEYRPGAQAKIKFQLTDGAGKKTPGAISLAAVDEAVFAVLSQRPGLEQAFFLAEQELLKPIYTIYPNWSPASATATPQRELLEDAVFSLTAFSAQGEINIDNGFRNDRDQLFKPQMLAGSSVQEETANRAPVFARTPITLVANSFPAKEAAVAHTRAGGLRSVAVAWFVLISSVLVFGVIAFAVTQPKAFMVTAGVLFVLMLCGGPLVIGAAYFLGHSEYATAVKSEAGFAPRAAMEGPLLEMSMPIPSEAIPTTETAAPSAPPRVRQYFPETLLWQPELVTNDDGSAELTIDLADSITTWRISASAVSAGGQLGDAQIPLKVFQPFFVDLNLPVALPRNDEVSVPVVVYNYLDKPQAVTLQLDEAPWFKLLADEATTATDSTQSLELAAGEVRSLHYRLKVLHVGQQQLKVVATGGGVADAIERSIEVIPNGTLVEVVRNQVLDTPGAPVVIDVTIPEESVPGSVRAFVKFHPSGFSQLVEGLDAIFRMPGGCFEQTSSTTYPNVLALDYLRSTNKSLPQVEAKARQYIHAGYQRLISFEVPGGGFDWFGNPPANRTLTAYGLLEFVDMARVHDVDPQLIVRTRQWLMAQRHADGSWEPEPHMLNDGLASSINRGEDARLAATAYIAWAMFHSLPHEQRRPEEQRAFQLTANYLLAHKPEAISDPYVLATVSMALASFDPKLPELDRYLAQLDSLKQSDDKSCWWEQPVGAARPFYGNGQTGKIETTAMATLAMLRAKSYAATTNKALHWLVINKDPQGTWYSTQSTVLALQALLLGTNAAAEAKDRKFEIKVNDQLVQQLTIPADQADVVKQLDLSPWLTKFDEPNHVSITETTASSTTFQAVFRHHIEKAAEPNVEPLSIALAYDRERLTVDETVTVTATIINNMDTTAPMVILDLPIPGGFALEPSELDELVGSRKIEKYQLTPRQAIVYLRSLEPKPPLELRYRLKATMPVKVNVPRGAVYEYYNPAKRGASEPAQLEATIKT